MIYILADVDWLTVLVGTAVSYLVGWVWYSPRVYGKIWADGLGVDISGPPPITAMALLLVGYFILNIFINILVITEAGEYLFVAGLGFILTGYSGETFAGHPRIVKFINAGCQVVILSLAMSVQQFVEHLALGY